MYFSLTDFILLPDLYLGGLNRRRTNPPRQEREEERQLWPRARTLPLVGGSRRRRGRTCRRGCRALHGGHHCLHQSQERNWGQRLGGKTNQGGRVRSWSGRKAEGHRCQNCRSAKNKDRVDNGGDKSCSTVGHRRVESARSSGRRFNLCRAEQRRKAEQRRSRLHGRRETSFGDDVAHQRTRVFALHGFGRLERKVRKKLSVYQSEYADILTCRNGFGIKAVWVADCLIPFLYSIQSQIYADSILL